MFTAAVIKQETLEQKEPTSRDWISPVPEVEVGGSGPGGPFVRARKDIPRGARFGPFRGKWASQPFNPRYAWEVSPKKISITTRITFLKVQRTPNYVVPDNVGPLCMIGNKLVHLREQIQNNTKISSPSV